MQLVVFVIKLISKLPLSVLYRLANLLRFVFEHVIAYRKAVIVSNLKNSFPEKSETEIASIARGYYKYLSRMMVETIKTWSITDKELNKRVQFLNPEIFQTKLDQGKSIIIMMGHSGNWEWAGLATKLRFGMEMMPVYRRIKSKPMDKFYSELRSKFGVKPVLDKSAFQEINAESAQKAVAMLADQTPSAKKGWWLQFLNQNTPFYRGSEILAKRLGYDVVFAHIRNSSKAGHYEIIFEDLTPYSNDNHQLTLRFAELLENEIKKDPTNWLWSHKRWKHKPLESSQFIS